MYYLRSLLSASSLLVPLFFPSTIRALPQPEFQDLAARSTSLSGSQLDVSQAGNLTAGPADPYKTTNLPYIITFHRYTAPTFPKSAFFAFMAAAKEALEIQTQGVDPAEPIPGGEFWYATPQYPMQIRLFAFEGGDGLTWADVFTVLTALSDWGYIGDNTYVPSTQITLEHLESILSKVGFGYLQKASPAPPLGFVNGIRTGSNGTAGAGEVATA